MKSLRQRLANVDPDELYRMVYQDPTTKVLNRRAYDDTSSEFVAIIDLDSLKWVNDEIGHRAGDSILSHLAAAMVRVFGEDSVFRVSGDEFVVRTNKPGAVNILRRLQQQVPVFSFGFARDIVQADTQLRAQKAEREATNLRASRGGEPPWAEWARKTFEGLG